MSFIKYARTGMWTQHFLILNSLLSIQQHLNPVERIFALVIKYALIQVTDEVSKPY